MRHKLTGVGIRSVDGKRHRCDCRNTFTQHKSTIVKKRDKQNSKKKHAKIYTKPNSPPQTNKSKRSACENKTHREKCLKIIIIVLKKRNHRLLYTNNTTRKQLYVVVCCLLNFFCGRERKE